MTKLKLLTIAIFAISLGACASQNIPDPEPDGSSAGNGGEFGNTDGFDDGTFGEPEEIPFDSDDGELAMVIYFDFDQSEIRPEDQATLEGHANRMANNGSDSVRLEGHADERGSREYNIGLGERRSQAVRRLLMIQGASAGQISTVSFGEERPVAFGSDEISYAQNRRVEIRYTGN